MSAGKQVRFDKLFKVTIAAGAAVSGEIDIRRFAAGIIYMPDTWTAADLGVKIAHTSGGTFQPLKDQSNGYDTTVSLDGVVASACYPLPEWCFAAPFIKLWSHNGSGTDTNQAADRDIYIMFKS